MSDDAPKLERQYLVWPTVAMLVTGVLVPARVSDQSPQ